MEIRYIHRVYPLYTIDGKYIRKASLVQDLKTGWVIRFIDRLPKQTAIKQAIILWEKEGRDEE